MMMMKRSADDDDEKKTPTHSIIYVTTHVAGRVCMLTSV